jgi:DNA mismatch repair protein MutL
VDEAGISGIVELVLEDYKKETDRFMKQANARIARSLAMRTSIRAGRKLQTEEMSAIWSDLISCQAPENSPDGKPTMFQLSQEELAKKFKSI